MTDAGTGGCEITQSATAFAPVPSPRERRSAKIWRGWLRCRRLGESPTVGVVGADERGAQLLRSSATFGNLFQHGGRSQCKYHTASAGATPTSSAARTLASRPPWNPLQPIAGQDIGRTADNLVGAFKSFATHWGDRLEHLLRHAFFAFLHLPGSTLLDVANILQNRSQYAVHMRDVFLDAIGNEVARRFWLYDLKKYGKDDLGPPRNKLSKLLVNQPVSLMLSQPDSAFNFRDVMDNGMIFLADLSSAGSEVREVLGCLMLSLLHQTAISRSDTAPAKRRPFLTPQLQRCVAAQLVDEIPAIIATHLSSDTLLRHVPDITASLRDI